MLVSGRWHGTARTLYMAAEVGWGWTLQSVYVLKGSITALFAY